MARGILKRGVVSLYIFGFCLSREPLRGFRALKTRPLEHAAILSPIEEQAAERFAFITPAPATDWAGFTGLLDSWIDGPKFNHTHYLDAHDYHQAFYHVFLMVGRLRKRLIAVIINDTGAGDHRDEIRLVAGNMKFKIRPI